MRVSQIAAAITAGRAIWRSTSRRSRARSEPSSFWHRARPPSPRSRAAALRNSAAPEDVERVGEAGPARQRHDLDERPAGVDGGVEARARRVAGRGARRQRREQPDRGWPLADVQQRVAAVCLQRVERHRVAPVDAVLERRPAQQQAAGRVRDNVALGAAPHLRPRQRRRFDVVRVDFDAARAQKAGPQAGARANLAHARRRPARSRRARVRKAARSQTPSRTASQNPGETRGARANRLRCRCRRRARARPRGPRSESATAERARPRRRSWRGRRKLADAIPSGSAHSLLIGMPQKRRLKIR